MDQNHIYKSFEGFVKFFHVRVQDDQTCGWNDEVEDWIDEESYRLGGVVPKKMRTYGIGTCSVGRIHLEGWNQSDIIYEFSFWPL